MNPKLIAPIVITALIVWRIYMRARRSFGRQRIRTRPMTMRIVVLSLAGAFVLVAAGPDVRTLAALLLGGACGAVLASIALRHTRFELTAEGRFYTPHRYIGLAVTALFLGRIAYDFLVLYHGMPNIAPGRGQYPAPGHYTPLTLAVSGAFIAYYLAYYIGVLRKSRPPVTSGGELIQSGPQGGHD